MKKIIYISTLTVYLIAPNSNANLLNTLHTTASPLIAALFKSTNDTITGTTLSRQNGTSDDTIKSLIIPLVIGCGLSTLIIGCIAYYLTKEYCALKSRPPRSRYNADGREDQFMEISSIEENALTQSNTEDIPLR